MILDILVAQDAKRLKVDVSSGEIEAEITRMMKERKVNRKQMEEQLAKANMTVDSLRNDIKKIYCVKKS